MKRLVVFNVLLVCTTFCPAHAAQPELLMAPSSIADGSLARQLLSIEDVVGPDVEANARLSALLTWIDTRYEVDRRNRVVGSQAEVFFRSVDHSLCELGVIYPPDGSVLLLRDALKPRTLSSADWARASSVFPNVRRRTTMERIRREKEDFYFFDCDMAAVIYLTVARKYSLPVEVAEFAGHSVLRWSGGQPLYWDPNDGVFLPPRLYEERLGRKEGRVTNDQDIRSYWTVLVGKCLWHKGDFSGAIAAFRRTLALDSNSAFAKNELAWGLATCPDAKQRNGSEARMLSGGIVALARKPQWLETLAAAEAECGNFDRAVSIETEARAIVAAAALGGSLAGYDQCISAYKNRQSYAQAVAAGVILRSCVDGDGGK